MNVKCYWNYKICSQWNKKDERHQTTFYHDICPDKPRMDLGNYFIIKILHEITI